MPTCTDAESRLIEAAFAHEQRIANGISSSPAQVVRAYRAVADERKPKTPEECFEADVRELYERTDDSHLEHILLRLDAARKLPK